MGIPKIIINEDLSKINMFGEEQDITKTDSLLRFDKSKFDERQFLVDPEINDVSTTQPKYTIEHDGVKVSGRRSEDYPNPTLFHFALAKYLRSENFSANTIVDAGCGVGFLGNYATKHFNPKKIIFADMSPNAITQAIESVHYNNGLQKIIEAGENRKQYYSHNKIYESRLGAIPNSVDDVKEATFLSAPYFMPGLIEVFPQVYTLFSYGALQNNNDIYFGHSSLTMPFIEQAMKNLEKNNIGANIESYQIGKPIPVVKEYAGDKFQKVQPSGEHTLMVSHISPK